ncbi:MAG: exopolysaccharide biosynthesis protein [Parvularculaceae bacterium]
MTDDKGSGRNMRGAAAKLHDILDELRAAAPVGADGGAQTARLGDVVDRLDERAFGFLLLLLALPCCLPFVYVLPQIVALPMMALAIQMAAGGRHPWLPKKLHDRSFSIPAFQNVLTRAEKWGGWIERIAAPRLKPVTGHLAHRIVGGLLLVPIISILTPLPSTNTVPGIGVAIAAIGLIERDGVLVIGGLLIGFVWVCLLLFLGAEAVHMLKSWLTGGA